MHGSRVEIRGSYRPPVPGARRVGTPDADEMIAVTVTVRGPEPPGADAHPAPALSRSRFEALFGHDRTISTRFRTCSNDAA